MEPNTVKIISMVIDKQNLILYKEDGSTIKVPQGSKCIRDLTSKLIPALYEQQFYILDLNELREEPIHLHYADAETKMNKVIRFFSTVKSKLASILKPLSEEEHDINMTINNSHVIPEIINNKLNIVNEIIDNSTPVSSEQFQTSKTEPKNNTENTVFAVIGEDTIITGIEQIDIQVKAIASSLGSPEGMINFFKRLSTVKRQHSIRDLLTFMQKGELPIADDGSVLVYKTLRKTSEDGIYVDCHTGQVKQRVGSIVEMHESKVDDNRNQECSYGLHIARRDYLKSFNTGSSEACFLCKLAPEDVIAVPHGDASKLRAMRYFIIAQLSDTDTQRVFRNQPLKDTVLIGNAIKGNHVDPIEIVHINGQQGNDITITSLEPIKKDIVLDQVLTTTSLDVISQEEAIQEVQVVDPIQVAKDDFVNNPTVSYKQQVRNILDKRPLMKEDALEILAIKKRTKRSLSSLGVTDKEEKVILKLLG